MNGKNPHLAARGRRNGRVSHTLNELTTVLDVYLSSLRHVNRHFPAGQTAKPGNAAAT